MDTKIFIALLVSFLFVLSGCSNYGTFEKKKECYDLGKGSEYTFYSPKLKSCINWFCWGGGTEAEPGCEIQDFFTGKVYKEVTCGSLTECLSRSDCANIPRTACFNNCQQVKLDDCVKKIDEFR